jgi:hypothetical protein
MRRTPQGVAQLDRRGRVRSYRPLMKQLDRLAAEARAAEKAAERAERAEQARQARHAEPSPQPSAPPPRPPARPWPTQAEIDGYADRMMADPDAPVTAELWERFAAHEQSKSAQERAMGTVVDLVATAWAARRAGS